VKLNIFNRKKRSTFDQKYSDLAKKRKRSVYSNRLKEFAPSVKFPKKLLFIPVIVLVGIIAAYLLSSTTFRVKSVYVSGDKDKESAIEADLESVKGRSIFLVRESDIANSIKSKYENIEDVYVYKFVPDRIEVEVVQSLPALVFSSFTKTTLVKKDGTSLGEVPSISSLKLLDYELKILNGEKDLNAQYIKDAFLSDLSTDDRKTFKFEDVKPEDKEAKFNQIHDSVFQKVYQYRDSIKATLENTDYKNLPFFFSFATYEDNPQIFNTALEVSDGLKFRNIIATNNLFLSSYTLEEDTDSGKQILFSTKREISEQFLDLDSIIFAGRFSSARIIDLRSTRYSIIQ